MKRYSAKTLKFEENYVAQLSLTTLSREINILGNLLNLTEKYSLCTKQHKLHQVL